MTKHPPEGDCLFSALINRKREVRRLLKIACLPGLIFALATCRVLPTTRLDIADSFDYSDFQRRILIGAPNELLAVLSELQTRDLLTVPTGAELAYIAWNTIQAVYPYLLGRAGASPSRPQNDLYVVAFDQVKQGRYPDIPPQKMNALIYSILPLAVLNSRLSYTDELCRQNLETRIGNEEALLTLLLMGFYWEKNSHPETAGRYYRQVLEKDAACYPAELGLARIALQNGQPGQAEEILTKLTALYPGRQAIVVDLARARLDQNRLTGVAELVASGLRRFPGNIDLQMLNIRLLTRQNDYAAAYRLLDRLQEDYPNQVAVRLLYGQTLEQGEGLARAISYVESSLLVFPLNQDLTDYHNRLLLAGQEIAQTRQQTSVGGDDGEVQTLANLRASLADAVENRQWPEAADLIGQTLRIADNLTNRVRAYEIYRRLDNPESADDLALETWQKWPTEARAGLIYIDSLLRQNQKKAAASVIASFTASSFSRDIQSRFYYYQSRILTSVSARQTILQKALVLDQRNQAAQKELAIIYADQRRWPLAFRYMRQAAALDPGDQQVAELLERYEQQLSESP